MEKISLNSTLKRIPEQIFSKVDQDVIMLSIDEGKYFALNESAARIWDLLEQPIEVLAIVNRLIDEFDISKKNCEIETIDLLNELHSSKLVILCETG